MSNIHAENAPIFYEFYSCFSNTQLKDHKHLLVFNKNNLIEFIIFGLKPSRINLNVKNGTKLQRRPSERDGSP